MDINTLRIAVTLASLALFVALMLHTFSRRRRDEFEQAEWLPFVGDEFPSAGPTHERAAP
jgi:cytochrome c oxidase cbb3-type subunit IV